MSALQWRRVKAGEYVARAHHGGPTYSVAGKLGLWRLRIEAVEVPGSPYRTQKTAQAAAANHVAREGAR